MTLYTEYEVDIGYIGGKTITIGYWSFSLRVFTTHSASNKRSWHKLASEEECKEQVDWSE